ncbi:hypothetical protein D3C83_161440 [compost metagenome]
MTNNVLVLPLKVPVMKVGTLLPNEARAGSRLCGGDVNHLTRPAMPSLMPNAHPKVGLKWEMKISEATALSVLATT